MTVLCTLMLNMAPPVAVDSAPSEFSTADIAEYFYAAMSGELPIWEINDYPVIGLGDTFCDQCEGDLDPAEYWYCGKCRINICGDCMHGYTHCQHQFACRDYIAASDTKSALQFEFGSIFDWLPICNRRNYTILINYNRDSKLFRSIAIMYLIRSKIYYQCVDVTYNI